MPGIELPTWSTDLFWAVEFGSVVPQSPTVPVAYIWLGWVISPNIAYAFCMMYARLLAPNATAGLQRRLLSCHKIRTADQVVFLRIYNTINTQEPSQIEFYPPNSVHLPEIPKPFFSLEKFSSRCTKTWVIFIVSWVIKKTNKQNPRTLDYI